ncbi:SdrD B-like domain-containing protein [Methanolobus sp. WCC5]|uniref:SdrD B-like domain-containing protein n=1 Tax=Methanolobus sp. WCC5 TaxID=3125785 RepID=UPI0032454091
MLRSKNDHIWKTIKIAVIASIVLILLSLPASACDHGYIGDRVWNDLDKDGKQDRNEPGLSGVKVNLYKCDGTYLKNTTTDSAGKYIFKVDGRKNYYVEFELPEGFVFSPRDRGSKDYKDSDADEVSGRTICTYISKGEYDCRWDAGMYEEEEPEPAAVGNFVWLDGNNNGIQENGESGIPGVIVELYTCSGQLVANTTTDGTGFYEFTGLDAGDYKIVFIKPTGYVFAPVLQGGDPSVDSDADTTTGETVCFTLNAGDYYDMVDTGLFRSEQEIPEFPTVAIPMIAILGMAFVFRRRKE